MNGAQARFQNEVGIPSSRIVLCPLDAVLAWPKHPNDLSVFSYDPIDDHAAVFSNHEFTGSRDLAIWLRFRVSLDLISCFANMCRKLLGCDRISLSYIAANLAEIATGFFQPTDVHKALRVDGCLWFRQFIFGSPREQPCIHVLISNERSTGVRFCKTGINNFSLSLVGLDRSLNERRYNLGLVAVFFAQQSPLGDL